MKIVSKISLNVIAVFLVVLMIVQSVPVLALDSIGESSDINGSPVDTAVSEPYIEYEDASLRDEATKHFRLSNGTNLAVRYNRPVHALDDNGEWVDIDLPGIYDRDETSGEGSYTMNACSTAAKLSGTSAGTLFELSDTVGEGRITFSLDSDALNNAAAKALNDTSEETAEETAAEKNLRIINKPLISSALTYKNVYEGVDIISSFAWDGVCQQFIINSNCSTDRLSAEISAGELAAEIDGLTGDIVFCNDLGDTLYYIEAPQLSDARDRIIDGAYYELTEIESGEYELTVHYPADAELSDENVSYPLSLEISAKSVDSEASAVESRYVSSAAEDWSYSGSRIKVGSTGEDKISREYVAITQLPDLSEAGVLFSAKLCAELRFPLDGGNSAIIEGHAITGAFDIDTLTWDAQPDYSAEQVLLVSKDNGDKLSRHIEFDITETAREYNSGAAGGIVLVSSDEALGTYAAVELCPYILLNYLPYADGEDGKASNDEDIASVGTASDGDDTDDEWEMVAGETISINGAENETQSAASANAASKTFKEITSELELSYFAGDTISWRNLFSTTTVDHFDGIRIRTSNSRYVLKYRSNNSDVGWLGYVFSDHSGTYDYAGLSNRKMYNIGIEVYGAGMNRLFDDYVVMYRAKTDGVWLEWVSNGNPDVMKTISNEFSLSGSLDTSSTDAGWKAKGPIQALEIRMFERIGSDTGSGIENPGAGDFKTADGITMSYYKNRTLYNLNSSVSVDSMDGVRLQTSGKPYYLYYRSRNASHGWLSFVSSDNSGETDYAGWHGCPMSNLEIQVYLQGGTRIFDDYVVMYRANVTGYGWLDWVSNGTPSVMDSISRQFSLSGGLDTAATEAGWGASDKITALDIRIYERKNMDPVPSSGAKIISKVPYLNQFAENFPNGCESTSTVMALQYATDKDIISLSTFVDNYLDWVPETPYHCWPYPDPNEVYMGYPWNNKNAWGCFAPTIMKALHKIEGRLGITATNITGASLDTLKAHIRNGTPVIMWATVGMTSPSSYKTHTWTTAKGETVNYNGGLHCLVLIGYDTDYYYFNDPMQKAMKGYPRDSVEAAYNALGKQAIIITKATSSGSNTPIPVGKRVTVTVPEEINKKPATSDDYHADPIDMSTGAHVIDHSIMTVHGAQDVSFSVNYRSNLLTDSSVGRGWSHNYEKHIEYDGENDIIYVYDNAAYFAIFTRSGTDTNVYTSETVTKENYTVTKNSDGYTLNCNYASAEHYNAAGQLVKIISKGGLNTLLSYGEGTVTVTDEVSGKYIVLHKNSDGKIVSVTDNSGRTAALGYIDGNLVSITDADDDRITYVYNEKGQIIKGRDHNNVIFFTNEYDSLDRVTAQRDATETGSTTIRYDSDEESGITTVTVTDRTDAVTVYKYNSAKQLVSKTDPNGVEVKYEYDSRGNLIKKTDGLNHSVVNVYDARNNLVSTTDRRGSTTLYEYDARNNLTKVTYPGGAAISYVYDSADHLISSTDLRGTATVYEYNAQNLVSKVTCGSRESTFEYTNGRPTKITDPMGRETLKAYNSAGLVISSTDADNNVTTYTYDNRENLLTVTNAANGVTSQEYDPNGQVIKSTDAKGNITAYTYNGNLKKTSVTLPDGSSVYYEYDSEDRLIKTVYPNNTAEEYTYDAGGRLISKKDREGNTETYTYDAGNNITCVTNPAGGTVLKEYDEAGNLVKETKVIQILPEVSSSIYVESTEQRNVTQYVYDANGRLVKTINPAGGEILYAYNNAGDLVSVTDALGNATVNVYNSYGELVKVTDPRGGETSYTYDMNGNLTAAVNALGQTTTNTYDSLNRLISTADPGGHTVSYEYDALGRKIKTTDANGNTETVAYDAVGNVISVTNSAGHVDYAAVYDSMGRATSVTDAAGSTTARVYDSVGNMTSETNALSQTVTYSYDGAGKMVSAVDKAGKTSYSTYDGMGNLTSVTGPLGSNITYLFNTSGQLSKKSAANGNTVYMYNALGLLDSVRDATLALTSYSYDAAGRVTSFTNNDGTTSYTYDANGNVLTASDSSGTITREYDALNRVTKYTDTYGNVIEYEYDVCGNLAKMVYPTGEEGVYTYDANHNMTQSSVTDDSGTKTVTYEYNYRNQVKKAVNVDGSVVTKSYDSAGRLQVVNDRTKTGQYISVFIYMYDALGRITSEMNPISGKQYNMTYDVLGRVTARTEVNSGNGEVINEESFTYDDAGNIAPDDEDIVYEYNSDNTLKRILQKYEKDGEIKYRRLVRSAYDVRGNVTAIKTKNGYYQNVTYDAKNRLKKAEGDYSEYWYDADDNRIDMYDHSTNMKYTYDCAGGRSRLVWTSSHLYEVTTYAYGAEGLIWSRTDGSYQVYHYDYRGSVIAVTDIDGNITDTITYTAYGKQASRTGTSKLIFGYNGRHGVLSDPNGLLYMRTRFYNPDFKRFMSADIIDGSIADSTSLNVYAFVNGNPISLIDPFGLSSRGGEDSSSNSKIPGIMHDGNFYPIYVPNHVISTVELPWKTIDEDTNPGWNFDGIKFVTGIHLEDINGEDVYAGPVKVLDGYRTDKDAIKALGLFSVLTGVLDSLSNSLQSIFINFQYQECGDQRRVIISVGSSTIKGIFNNYAGDIKRFGIESTGVGSYDFAGSLFHDLTGQDIDNFYDVQITVDEAHRGSAYASYLSITADGTVIETPIIYPKDEIAVGKGKGLFGFGFEPSAYVPLGGSYRVSPKYQELFDKYADVTYR